MKQLAFAIFLLTSGFVHAGYSTGKELLIACTGAVSNEVQAAVMRFHCLGYIDGVIDAHGILSTLEPSIRQFCAPTLGLEAGDALDKIIVYLSGNSEAKNTSGRVAVLKALQNEYPCK